jgi:ornithine carbamoyltransferase
MRRHFLDVDDLSVGELDDVLARARRRDLEPVLAGRGAALLFEKPSARTRNSTELAVTGLGGHPVYIGPAEVGIDEREPAEDVARTLACYHSVICARVNDHRTLTRMAAALDAAELFAPVVNLLSDVSHPCQALADLLTLADVADVAGSPAALAGRSVAYIGDANNVCASLAKAAVMVGMSVRVASPEGYEFDDATRRALDDLAAAAGRGGTVSTHRDPAEAAKGADALYTDVWTSMGQEAERPRRLADFAGYCVDEALLAAAASDAVILHCLPAHRGEEITAAVVDGPHSVVWRQAAHRETAMRGLLSWLVSATGSERAQP